MEYVVEFIDVRKSYGSREVLRGISFRVAPGEIYCLVGPNGAGKTTTLRIAATLAKPTSGSVRILGVDLRENRDLPSIRRRISYLPEEADVYSRLSGLEYLRFFAELYGLDVEKALDIGIRISGLSINDLRRRAGTYSKGMRRRLLIARVFMSEPRLAILDEPTSGLDVFSSLQVREAIKEYSKPTGSSVILSSHNMFEVEYLCDRVALINNGVIVGEGSVEEIKRITGAKNLEESFVSLVSRSGG
ncbi:MAG: multidrug ABC transporter ATP-binding protein [Desulfurococcaceae archaeon]|nr:MAG: multidrug ABC transporter ATP-binding protein [Desulfurococcaceae archaeon]